MKNGSLKLAPKYYMSEILATIRNPHVKDLVIILIQNKKDEARQYFSTYRLLPYIINEAICYIVKFKFKSDSNPIKILCDNGFIRSVTVEFARSGLTEESNICIKDGISGCKASVHDVALGYAQAKRSPHLIEFLNEQGAKFTVNDHAYYYAIADMLDEAEKYVTQGIDGHKASVDYLALGCASMERYEHASKYIITGINGHKANPIFIINYFKSWGNNDLALRLENFLTNLGLRFAKPARVIYSSSSSLAVSVSATPAATIITRLPNPTNLVVPIVKLTEKQQIDSQVAYAASQLISIKQSIPVTISRKRTLDCKDQTAKKARLENPTDTTSNKLSWVDRAWAPESLDIVESGASL